MRDWRSRCWRRWRVAEEDTRGRKWGVGRTGMEDRGEEGMERGGEEGEEDSGWEERLSWDI